MVSGKVVLLFLAIMSSVAVADIIEDLPPEVHFLLCAACMNYIREPVLFAVPLVSS